MKIIPQKQDRLRATDELNADLAALFQFGQPWFMDFAPLKTRSLLISLKRDTFDHPPLFMNNCPIAEVSSLKILGFMLDSSFTWGPHMDMIISRSRQRLAQLYRLSPYLDSVGLSIMYKSFVRSCLEYGHLLYFGAARGYLKRLDALQCRAASICHSTFPSLESRRCAAVIGLLCRLLDGEGRGDLQSFVPRFVTSAHRRSSRLNNLSDPAQALRLQNPIIFRTLDCYHRSWHSAILSIWNTLPANLLLQDHDMGWRSVLKALQCCCC